ncbi:MAG: hypothetical protein QOI80_919, partial [Solirubrobacteraceae bacterium]|nr:hypothetical protein [Solirubrobacteraceae bacterium]
MKRLAVFLPDFAGGGAERSLIAIAGKVAATGVQVAVVVARDTGPLRGSVPADVSIVALNARRTATSVLQLARFLRAWRPDAVLTGITHSNLTAIAAARLARSPATLVVTEHTDMRAARARPENRRSRILPALVRRLYPRADAVVAVSAGVADGLASEAGIARAAIRVIFNPVDCAAITAAAQERLTVPLGEAGVPLVAAVGRLHPDKRLDVLVRVVARINDTSPVSLAICGEGETRDALEPLIAALGMEHRIRLL